MLNSFNIFYFSEDDRGKKKMTLSAERVAVRNNSGTAATTNFQWQEREVNKYSDWKELGRKLSSWSLETSKSISEPN
jgi:hypothetical protein